jgi:hypothetical protein
MRSERRRPNHTGSHASSGARAVDSGGLEACPEHDTLLSDMPTQLSLSDAARRAGLSAITLRQAARSGALAAEKIANRWLTTPAAVDAYVTERRPRGRPSQSERVSL